MRHGEAVQGPQGRPGIDGEPRRWTPRFVEVTGRLNLIIAKLPSQVLA